MSATLLTNRPLAASESFTQAIRDRFNDREPIGAVRALVYADKAGTLYLEESDDEGAHYAAAATVSVSAATTTELAWTALTKRWYRFRYANSTTAQTNFRLIQQTRGLDVHKVDTEAITGAGEAAKTLADVISTLAAGISLSGSNPEKGSVQDTQPATTAKIYNRAAGASRMEVYCESGYIRVRTDGQPCTSTTGEPIAAGFGAAWNAESISVFYVQESILTVVSR